MTAFPTRAKPPGFFQLDLLDHEKRDQKEDEDCHQNGDDHFQCDRQCTAPVGENGYFDDSVSESPKETEYDSDHD